MAKTLWSGRFKEGTADLLRRLNDSLWFDRALHEVDVRGSVAWAGALQKAAVLSAREASRLVAGLRRVAPPPEDADDEDIHAYVERTLTEDIGPLGGKLHTGRSRNDQVATDLRLYVRDAFDEARALVQQLATAMAVRAELESDAPMPGYTHSKRAEPVTFGHWLLAHTEPLRRDLERFDQARTRANVCPLGSGALSGTPIAIDRQALAVSLDFARASANSMDGVADRDFVSDYLYCSTLLLSHLSRMAEDLIFFQTDEAAFVSLPDALATGSSRMPQKKNPDLLELCRGHAGRVLGELTGILALLKGLPLAYDKDLQLDKEPVFRTRAVLASLLPAVTALIDGLRLDRERMAAAAGDERLLATALADALADRGVPFRHAHEIVGKRFREAEEANTSMALLGASDGITAEDLCALELGRVLGRRKAIGGTAPARVAAAAKAALRELGKRKS
ncbi:MAG: argininosuccinate lyase [Polyangia bacterium]